MWDSTDADPSSGPFTETLLGKTIHAPPHAFFQVNIDVTIQVVKQIRDRFIQSRCTTVIDAYCGVGLFSFFLADRAAACIGIEQFSAAIGAARQTARELQLTNCTFVRGRAEKQFDQVIKKTEPNKTCVLLDPPRSGCSPQVLDRILTYLPNTILYVSCNPPILARDI